MKLKNNISFEAIIKAYENQFGSKYNEYQLDELRHGYESNLDISMYANPTFHHSEMYYVRLGLEANLDVSKYARVDYGHFMMELLHQLLKSGANFDNYILIDRLNVDRIIYDYDLLAKNTSLDRLDKWFKQTIYTFAPYYIKEKYDEIDK